MAELGGIETAHVEPMAQHAELWQRLREDVVSEVELSEEFQAIAAKTGMAKYLVQKVIGERGAHGQELKDRKV